MSVLFACDYESTTEWNLHTQKPSPLLFLKREQRRRVVSLIVWCCVLLLSTWLSFCISVIHHSHPTLCYILYFYIKLKISKHCFSKQTYIYDSRVSFRKVNSKILEFGKQKMSVYNTYYNLIYNLKFAALGSVCYDIQFQGDCPWCGKICHMFIERKYASLMWN